MRSFAQQLKVSDVTRAAPSPVARKRTTPVTSRPTLEHEREADQVAEQVMRAPAPTPGSEPSRVLEAPSHAARRGYPSPGQPLDSATRGFMEARFGHDFSRVRVHADGQAARSASARRASAYTSGDDLVFGAGRYSPATTAGRRLIAHELTHTLQQQSAGQVQCYSEAERRAMAEGRVTGRQSDIDLANQRHFEPGDIVFRSGSTALGILSGQPVTHGGIYIGDGLIHDAVGFGNRLVRVSDFYDPSLNEAANRDVYRVVRFRGPLRELIFQRLLRNIRARDFSMPTDPVPFNLFSSADDYRTANCLEYAHAQFLYAIQRLATDAPSESDRAQLRRTYFASGASTPSPLIRPDVQRLRGGTGGRFKTPRARAQEAILMAAADGLATDVDPRRFANRSEADHEEYLWGIAGDEVILRTFTYRSFVDSRIFFQDVTLP